jgi:hypothetical protein
MGERAGTASAVMGFSSAAGGAVLAGIVSARIGETVTPMATGYVVYSAVAVALLWWARRAAPADRRSSAVSPSPTAG